jgi:hypothetical protein
MSDATTNKGNIVIGGMLVLTGVAIALERVGILHWRNQWTLWPLILGGIGLARFLQSCPGQPKQGLLFMTAAVWLLLGEAGWVSLGDSWPIAIIVLGVIVALNGGRRRQWHVPETPDEPSDPKHVKRLRLRERPLSGLAVLGIWIAVIVAVQVSGIRTGIRSLGEVVDGDRLRVVSVMGRAEHTSRNTTFQGGDVTNVMGRSEIDLTDAVMEPGASASLQVFSMMGNVVVRVPPEWTVDTSAVSALGGLRDDRGPRAGRGRSSIRVERDAPLTPEAPDPDAKPASPDVKTGPAPPDVKTGPAPRLVLRGLVMFGRLSITS